MLELDLVLLPFVEEVFPGLDRENQDRYIRMLECEDQDLFSWVMTRTVPDEADLAIIVKLIVDHARTRKGSA
jgi:antitoxin CptB